MGPNLAPSSPLLFLGGTKSPILIAIEGEVIADIFFCFYYLQELGLAPFNSQEIEFRYR